MPKGPRGEKRPADAIGRAVQVAKIATGEVKDTRYEQPNKAIGGRVGGKARGKKLSPVRKSEIGKQGARAKWSK